MSPVLPKTVALFPWGDVIEDYLDSIDISFEDFCEHMTGGWLFGYIEALKLKQIQTVIFCISAQTTEVNYFIHRPTGAKICQFPSPTLHRWMRQRIVNPYAGNLEDVFKVIPFGQRFFWALIRDIIFYFATPLKQVSVELKNHNCCAILCQEYEYPRFDLCIALGKILRIPVYATFQGGNFQLSRLERLIRPFTLQACAGLIVASQAESQRLRKEYDLPVDKISRIFNPLDMKLWQLNQSCNKDSLRNQVRIQFQIPNKAKLVIFHGRIEIHRKGLDTLIEAWEQLGQQYPHQEWWLLLIGTGNDADELKMLIRSLPKQSVCWLNQYILDRLSMSQYLSAADLYVLSSRHEGFPVAPLEAMCCGLPIVATDAPGVPDILEAGEDSGGILVPRGKPDKLAESLANLLLNDAKRIRLAERATHRVQAAFSLTHVGDQLDSLLSGKATKVIVNKNICK